MVTLAGNLKKEKAIQEEIFQAVDGFQSFIFNAGAGAGKTYALIETLKYLLRSKGTQLKKRNQKIVCITYTNVAANEIKKRLGNTQLIEVSTIHEMLWKQIKSYKSLQLVKIHLDKIKSILNDKEMILNNQKQELSDRKSNSKEKNTLNINLQGCLHASNFHELLSDEATEVFYKLDRECTTANFKINYLEYFNNDHDYLNTALKNVNDFKSFMKDHFQIERYKKFIHKTKSAIDNNEKLEVVYDAMTNQDRLTSMRFSHDTLLEYSYQMFKQYPLLNTIFMDKYPYLFIDEYQDTHKIVIDLVKNLYEKREKKPWLVGFFGDHKQSIYDDGIGQELFNENKKKGASWLKVINKPFNRRSPVEVIELINKVRNEADFQQIPLNPQNKGGDVRFFEGKSFLSEEESSKDLKYLTKRVIETYRQKYPEAERIDCFVALNKTITELGEFSEVYDAANTNNLIYWNNINTQLLSHDLTKLHPAILLFYNTLNFYYILSNLDYSYRDLLGDKIPKVDKNEKGGITLKSAKNLYSQLLTDLPNKTSKLDIFINHLSSVLSQVSKALRALIIKTHFQNMPFNNKETLEKEDFKKAFRAYLTELINKEEYDIDNILNIDIEIWLNWFEYIKADEEKDIYYHTFHSTKGEEYEHVIIMIGHDSGSRQGKDKFKNYFLALNDSPTKEKSSDFIDTQNLLYVIFSRAIKNLWIVYIDPIEEIKDGIEKIFKKIDNVEVL